MCTFVLKVPFSPTYTRQGSAAGSAVELYIARGGFKTSAGFQEFLVRFVHERLREILGALLQQSQSPKKFLIGQGLGNAEETGGVNSA